METGHPQGYYQPQQPGLAQSSQVVVNVGAQPGYKSWNWCHFVTSVIGFFCCQPFGTIALVMSLLAYSDHKSKDFGRASSKRSCGLGFGIAAIVIGSLSFIIFIIAYSIIISTLVNRYSSSSSYWN